MEVSLKALLLYSLDVFTDDEQQVAMFNNTLLTISANVVYLNPLICLLPQIVGKEPLFT